MSLPEELPLLDCNKLLKHLRQVQLSCKFSRCVNRCKSHTGNRQMFQTYHCLSSRVDSAAAQHLFEDLKKQTHEASEHHLHKGASSSNADEDAAAGAKKPLSDAESQLSKGNGTPRQTGPSCPPLNPFMVPVNLLRRR